MSLPHAYYASVMLAVVAHYGFWKWQLVLTGDWNGSVSHKSPMEIHRKR